MRTLRRLMIMVDDGCCCFLHQLIDLQDSWEGTVYPFTDWRPSNNLKHPKTMTYIYISVYHRLYHVIYHQVKPPNRLVLSTLTRPESIVTTQKPVLQNVHQRVASQHRQHLVVTSGTQRCLLEQFEIIMISRVSRAKPRYIMCLHAFLKHPETTPK